MASRGANAVAGYNQLTPLRQGSLDRLCGLYAIINAVSLAAYPYRPLTPHQRRLLFDRGIEYLAGPRLGRANLEGMRERPWMRLRDRLLAELASSGGPSLKAVPLLPERPSDPERLEEVVIRAIDAGFPVSLALWGAYDHYTVVAGYTPTRLLLFDSWGFRHIDRRLVGLHRPRSTDRHRVPRASVAAIYPFDTCASVDMDLGST